MVTGGDYLPPFMSSIREKYLVFSLVVGLNDLRQELFAFFLNMSDIFHFSPTPSPSLVASPPSAQEPFFFHLQF